MQHRKLGRCVLTVSEVGLGCEHLQGLPFTAVDEVVQQALACGINLLDVFMSEPQVRTDLGQAIGKNRDKVVLQGHIGSAWLDGQYTRTRNLSQCKRFFDDFRIRLNTDVVDIGMIHFVDTTGDLTLVKENGILDYCQKLKSDGVIRAVGMSSHNPLTAMQAVREGWLDVLMFSVNPAYDILPESATIDELFEAESYHKQGVNGENPVRRELYQLCEQNGVSITVMKGLAAGALLQAESSPFGTALSLPQCMHYALTRPAVASILVGCRTPQEVLAAVAYETASDRQRDFSGVLSQTPAYSYRGRCMYCNHCLPCPAHIDIAKVNQYLDLALAQSVTPATVLEHYRLLENHASDCIGCGQCEERCPFEVKVRSRMEHAASCFGL